MTVREFRSTHSKSLRIHEIKFDDPGVSVNGLGIPGRDELDLDAWQFAVSANEHGRVHGFMVADTFYIRWLDPNHNLYGARG